MLGFVELPCAGQQALSLLGCDDRQRGKIASHEHVPVRRCAQEHPALASGLDHRGDRTPTAIDTLPRSEALARNLDRISPGCVEGPLREFHVAANRVRTPVCDMATARGCGLDDKAIDEARAHRLDPRSPRLERHASQVEVDHLEVTRDASAHQAQITPGGPGEPSRVLRRRWEPRLVRLPRAQGNALVVALADRRQYAEPRGGISPGGVQG